MAITTNISDDNNMTPFYENERSYGYFKRCTRTFSITSVPVTYTFVREQLRSIPFTKTTETISLIFYHDHVY